MGYCTWMYYCFWVLLTAPTHGFVCLYVLYECPTLGSLTKPRLALNKINSKKHRTSHWVRLLLLYYHYYYFIHLRWLGEGNHDEEKIRKNMKGNGVPEYIHIDPILKVANGRLGRQVGRPLTSFWLSHNHIRTSQCSCTQIWSVLSNLNLSSWHQPQTNQSAPYMVMSRNPQISGFKSIVTWRVPGLKGCGTTKYQCTNSLLQINAVFKIYLSKTTKVFALKYT